MLFFILLPACQNTPPKAQETSSNQPEPDLVMMPGAGGTSSRAPTIGVKAMTIEELTTCAGKIDKLVKETAGLKTESNLLEKKKIEVDNENKALELQRGKVDKTNPKKVAEFNKLLLKQMEVVKASNEAVSAYTRKANDYNLRSNDYNANCVHRAYRQSDLEKLPADLRLAMEVRSETLDIPILEDAPVAETASPSGTVHLGGSKR